MLPWNLRQLISYFFALIIYSINLLKTVRKTFATGNAIYPLPIQAIFLIFLSLSNNSPNNSASGCMNFQHRCKIMYTPDYTKITNLFLMKKKNNKKKPAH